MLFAVIFQDAPDRLSVREQFLPAHLEWLAQNADVIKVAGSLRSTLTAAPEGGLWIIEADSIEQIEALVATDPFTVHELRAGWSIRYWSKAFSDRYTSV